jgi:hypothetical protein
MKWFVVGCVVNSCRLAASKEIRGVCTGARHYKYLRIGSLTPSASYHKFAQRCSGMPFNSVSVKYSLLRYGLLFLGGLLTLQSVLRIPLWCSVEDIFIFFVVWDLTRKQVAALHKSQIELIFFRMVC